MPPTRIGRHAIGTPSSAAMGWMLWKARYVHGLEQSKKNSIMAAPSRSHRALRPVLLVLRLDRRPRRLPLRVGPMAQLVEIGAGGVALPAIERDRLSGQPLAAVGEEKRRQVLQLLHAADPAHRVAALGALARRGAGVETLARAFGR